MQKYDNSVYTVDTRVINLDRRADRMEYIDKQLTLPYKRFSAVDGTNLSKYYEARPDYRRFLDIVKGRHRVLGEVGCSLSHYSIWKEVAENGMGIIPTLVLEDDICFTAQTSERFKRTMEDIHDHARNIADWDLIYVGGQWTADYGLDSHAHFQSQRIISNNVDAMTRFFKPVGGTLYRRINKYNSAVIQGHVNVWNTPLFRTAGAYIINSSGARHLMNAIESDTALFIKTPLDMWLLEMDFRGYIRTMDSITHPFYQGGFDLVTDPCLVANDIHRTHFEHVIV